MCFAKLLKQENLDLKLTPYKVIATGTKEGFIQFVDALPASAIINGECRTIKEYLKRNNPSDTDKYGIEASAMDAYVRSCGNNNLLVRSKLLQKIRFFKSTKKVNCRILF